MLQAGVNGNHTNSLSLHNYFRCEMGENGARPRKKKSIPEKSSPAAEGDAYRLFQTPHSFSVTIFTLGFRLFFILLQINLS